MRVSREKAEENRAAIVAAGSRLFREQGFDRVSVAEVCNDVGLTHGGFYGHFDSKDVLEAECCDRAFADKIFDLKDDPDVLAVIDRYLTAVHRDNPGAGCAMAALASEVPRREAAVREHFAAGVERHVEALAEKLGGEDAEARDRAILMLSAMVGALTLARATATSGAFSSEILASVRASLESLAPQDAGQG